MQFTIDFYAENEVFFMPGCIYFCDPERHYGKTQILLFEYEKVLLKEEKTIFIEYTYHSEYDKKNDRVRLGVIGRFIEHEKVLAIKILSKGTLYKDDENKMVFKMDPFMTKKHTKNPPHQPIDFDALYIIDSDFKVVKLNQQKGFLSLTRQDKVMHLLNRLVDPENLVARKELFSHYHYDFYEKIAHGFLSISEGYKIDTYKYQGSLSELKMMLDESIYAQEKGQRTIIEAAYPFLDDVVYNLTYIKKQVWLESSHENSDTLVACFNDSINVPLYTHEKKREIKKNKAAREAILRYFK